MGLLNFFRNRKQNSESEISDLETQKRGYHELGEICLSESTRTNYSDFISNIKDYSNDKEYMTTLNFVIENLYKQKNYFIICLDWKQEISSLTYMVNQVVMENFNLKLDLPQQEDYGRRASVSYENVFIDFDKAISKAGFQFSFIDTDSDQYILVIHRITDIEKAKNAINKIGYDCLSSSSRKISG